MDKRLFSLINKAKHHMFKFAETQSEQRLGISVTQGAAIMFIGKSEGCLQKELAKALILWKKVSLLAKRLMSLSAKKKLMQLMS